jgi:hypothetical protein
MVPLESCGRPGAYGAEGPKVHDEAKKADGGGPDSSHYPVTLVTRISAIHCYQK